MKVTVNYRQIRKNAEAIRRHLPAQTSFCAVLKANAYGHGWRQTALALKGVADWFAVARVREGVRLRSVCSEPVLVLGSCREHTAQALRCGLTLSVSCAEEVALVARAAKKIGVTAAVHVQADTGMNRFGVKTREELTALCNAAYACGIRIDGVYSHLCCTENAAFTALQRERFSAFVGIVKQRYPQAIAHLSATSGILLGKEYAFDMVRAGLALYGYLPTEEDPLRREILPAKTAEATVILVKKVRRGETIGYGNTFVAPNDMTIGLLDVGYADGLPRVLSNAAALPLGEGTYPIVGNVCMDCTAVDLTCARAKVGQKIAILGNNQKSTLHLDDKNPSLCIIIYELLCSLRETR